VFVKVCYLTQYDWVLRGLSPFYFSMVEREAYAEGQRWARTVYIGAKRAPAQEYLTFNEA